jgi:hypothetical protein
MQKFASEAREDKNRVTKGTDFLSRLKGFIDVASLDHDEHEVKANTLIRRAILLRSYLLQTPSRIVVQERQLGKDGNVESSSEIVKIDRGVLDAFLGVKKYLYGARSMQSIVKMSTLSGRAMFAPSSLPTEGALSLHVDSGAFMKIVRGEESLDVPPSGAGMRAKQASRPASSPSSVSGEMDVGAGDASEAGAKSR